MKRITRLPDPKTDAARLAEIETLTAQLTEHGQRVLEQYEQVVTWLPTTGLALTRSHFTWRYTQGVAGACCPNTAVNLAGQRGMIGDPDWVARLLGTSASLTCAFMHGYDGGTVHPEMHTGPGWTLNIQGWLIGRIIMLKYYLPQRRRR